MRKEIRNKDWEKVLKWCGLHIHTWGKDYGMLGEVTCKTCGESNLKYLDESGKKWTFLPANPYPLTLEMLYNHPITKLQEKGYATNLLAFEHAGYRANIMNMTKIEEYEVISGAPIEALLSAIIKVVENEK